MSKLFEQAGQQNIQIENNDIWPKLCSKEKKKDKNYSDPSLFSITQNLLEKAGTSEGAKALDYNEYPDLRKGILKRKRYVENNIIATESCTPDQDNVTPTKLEEKVIPKESTKRPKRNDLIRIDLQEVLDSGHNSKATNPDNSKRYQKCSYKNKEWQLEKYKRICVRRGKKKSKLRRMMEEKSRLDKKQFCKQESSKDQTDVKLLTSYLSSIISKKLKITADPVLDKDFNREMSKLSLWGNEYQSTKSKNEDLDDHFASKDVNSDFIESLSKLRVKKGFENDQDDEYETDEGVKNDEDNILHKTRCLSICNETGESSVNFEQLQIYEGVKHSRKFREYCTNILTQSLNISLEKFISELTRLQRKLYNRDNVKGRYKRKYYAGFKEIGNHLYLKKMKFVLIAPDLERVTLEGGLDEQVRKLTEACRKQDVAYGFGLGKRKLGYLLHGKGFVSCIGIANYDGAEEQFKDVLMELVEAKNQLREQKGNSQKKIYPKFSDDLLLSEKLSILLKLLASSELV